MKRKKDKIIKSKVALICSVVMLSICMSMFFPYPNNIMTGARTIFMSFPLTNQDGLIVLGIVGSIWYIIAMILLYFSMEKYRARIVILAVFVYAFLLSILIAGYQETFATGVKAISYDNNGSCSFKYVSKDEMKGECELVLHNRSNEDVTFELEFLDSLNLEEGEQRESLMNRNGPYQFTIRANQEKSISVIELLDVSDVPKRFDGASSHDINLKLKDEEITRIF